MKSKSSDWFRFVLFLSGIFIILAFVIHPVSAGAQITVDDDDPTKDYTTITDAVNNASAGDTILVYPGNYSEDVEITKQLTITSTDGPSVTHVNRCGFRHIFEIKADNVTINGLDISGASNREYAGIYLYESDGHTLTNNTFSSNYNGLMLYKSNNSLIRNNTMSDNEYAGVMLRFSCNNSFLNNTGSDNDFCMYCVLFYSHDNDFMNNTIYGNEYGIYQVISVNNTYSDNVIFNNSDYGINMENSPGTFMRSNSMFNNTYNFFAKGDQASSPVPGNPLVSDIDTSNTVNGRPIYYLVNDSDLVIDQNSNAGTVYCVNCENVSVEGLNFSDTGAGVYFYNTTGSVVENNNMSENEYGLYLIYSFNNSIMNNVFSADKYAAYLSSSNNTTFRNNEVPSVSSYGFQLYYSYYNIFVNNSLISKSGRCIDLSYSSNNNITGNVLSSGNYAIYLRDCDHNLVRANNFSSGTKIGLYLHGCSGNNITDNLLSISSKGIQLRDSISNILMNNTITDGMYGIYLYSSSHSNTLKNNSGSDLGSAMYVEESNNNIMMNNSFLTCSIGVNVKDSDDGIIKDNVLHGSLLLSESDDSIIINNVLYDYISLRYSDDSIIKNNELSGDKGLYMRSCDDTQIFNNLFNNTDYNVELESTNRRTVWNTTKTAGTNIAGGPYLGGNYWLKADGSGFSQTNGTDIDGDGFCDGAYNIDSGEIDYLPLVFLDTASPQVIDVSSVTSDGSYGAGSVINISVAFNEEVIVTGSPRLTLETGTTDRPANYCAGNSTSTLYFLYTVREGDVSSDLDYTGTDALTLSGGTINDTAGNAGILTLASPGAAHSLGANRALVIDTISPSGVSSLCASSTGSTWIRWTWANPSDSDFNHTRIYLNGTFKANVSGTSYNTTGLSDNSVYEFQTVTVDDAGNINSTWVNETASTANTLPPASISGLSGSSNGSTWINWTWANPADSDLNYTMIYLNGTFKANVSGTFYNATGLSDNTIYILATRTVDTAGNINSTWVNETARTPNTLPPSCITNLSVSDFGTTWINWTWNDPADLDFNHTMVYLDGVFMNNTTGTLYSATGLSPSSRYCISLRTVDTAGNINLSWTNATNCTVTVASSGSDSGSRTSVGQSVSPENVVSTDSGVKKVLAGAEVEYDLSGGQSPVLGVSFEAKSNEGNVFTNVQVLNSLPAGVSEDSSSRNKYERLSITVGSEGTISSSNADNIMINFKVSKQWVRENNINPATIRMTRYHDGAWEDLPTSKADEDDEYYYFTAQTPGFSIFEVVGDEFEEEVGPAEAVEPEVDVRSQGTAQSPQSEPVEKGPGYLWLIPVVGIVLGIGAFVFWKQNK